MPSAGVVGQFEAPGGDTWGALLEKDSELTACVSKAVDDLKSDGTLEGAREALDEQGRRRARAAVR